jgi:hypothetical protein
MDSLAPAGRPYRRPGPAIILARVIVAYPACNHGERKAEGSAGPPESQRILDFLNLDSEFERSEVNSPGSRSIHYGEKQAN